MFGAPQISGYTVTPGRYLPLLASRQESLCLALTVYHHLLELILISVMP